MSVISTHPAYPENAVLWQIIEDCINGQEAIKKAGETYLPKPSGMDNLAYKAYKTRAVFTMFTARAAEGLYGQIFSKLPEKQGEIPQLFQDFLDNVDKSGTSVDQFASDIVWATLQKPWGGILVDHSPVPAGISQAEKEKLGLTSFLRWYSAESVDNWRFETINDQMTLVLVKLKEVYHVIEDDKFNPVEKVRYRVLELVDGQPFSLSGMVYTQEIWEKATDKDEWAITETYIPEMDGKPLDLIPFFTCPAKEPEKSMLLPSAYLNIGHYQMTADYVNNLHLTGTPTAVGVNIEPELDKEGKAKPTGLGSSQIMFLNNHDGKEPKVFFLEPAGTGANNIRNGLESYEKNLEIMGGSPIKKSKQGVETAEAARIHQAGENSVLGSFSLNMSERLTQAVRFGARWRGVPEAITEKFNYVLNLDYEGDLTQIDSKNLAMREVDSGLMSPYRYLTEILGMSDEEATVEIQRINDEDKTIVIETEGGE
jgi:hypothetical protein